MTTVLFFSLDDLVSELRESHGEDAKPVVRVEGLYRAEPSEKTPALVLTKAEIHVRAILANGDPVAWMLQVGEVRVIHGHDRQLSEGETTLAFELKRSQAAVVAYLDHLGFVVRPGLVDISPSSPVAGHWDGLETWRKTAEVEVEPAPAPAKPPKKPKGGR